METTFSQRWRSYALYAWDARLAEWILAAIGGIAAGGYFLVTGQEVPLISQFHNNPFLVDAGVLVISVLAARILIFLARLAWAPAHFYFQLRGGFHGFLQTRLGAQMWPIILMASGIGAFVILFGSGMLWYVISTTSGHVAHNSSPSVLEYDVEGRIKALDTLYAAIEKSGQQLYDKSENLDFPWMSGMPWRQNIGFAKLPLRPTPENVKAVLPEIQELTALRQQVETDINNAVRYPYEDYLRKLVGPKFSFMPFTGDATMLTIAIDTKIKHGMDYDYMILVLNQNAKPFIDNLGEFRKWFSDLKIKIVKEREAELALLQKTTP